MALFVLFRNGKGDAHVYMELQEILNIQNNTEKNKVWRLVLNQSYSD